MTLQHSGALTNGGTLHRHQPWRDGAGAGDSFKLFKAASYRRAEFANVILPTPARRSGWNTNQLNTGGTLSWSSRQPVIGFPFFGFSRNGFVFRRDGCVRQRNYYLLASTNICHAGYQLTRRVTTSLMPAAFSIHKSSFLRTRLQKLLFAGNCPECRAVMLSEISIRC